QRAPNFAIDTKGVIHLAWVEARIGEQQDVWYVRSMDSGRTWSVPVSIMDADDSATYAQDFSAIAVDSMNNVYVAFLDGREVQRGTSDNMQLYMIKSSDQGMTWLPPVKANKYVNGIGGTCECCKLDIAASKEGHVYIAYRSDIKNRRDVWIARSMDQGVTWDSTILAQDGRWMINACPTTGPNITLDKNENLVVSWRDSRTSNPNNIVYVTVLPKGEDSVFRNVAMNPSSDMANWPDVAIDPNGVVMLGYQVSTDKGDRIHYKTSADGANSWMGDSTIGGVVPNTME